MNLWHALGTVVLAAVVGMLLVLLVLFARGGLIGGLTALRRRFAPRRRAVLQAG